jgi:hypothetical protein
VRRHPGEQRSGLRGLPAPREQRRRRCRGQAETGQPDRVLRQVHDRAQQVLVQIVEGLGERLEQPPPGGPVLVQAGHGLVD